VLLSQYRRTGADPGGERRGTFRCRAQHPHSGAGSARPRSRQAPRPAPLRVRWRHCGDRGGSLGPHRGPGADRRRSRRRLLQSEERSPVRRDRRTRRSRASTPAPDASSRRSPRRREPTPSASMRNANTSTRSFPVPMQRPYLQRADRQAAGPPPGVALARRARANPGRPGTLTPGRASTWASPQMLVAHSDDCCGRHRRAPPQ
jgi:hypothetical protein